MRKEFRRYSGIFSTLLLVFVLLFSCSSAGYANYVLDPDFGSGGLVRTDFGLGDDQACSLAIDSQGRIVVTGYGYSSATGNDFGLARYTSGGILDSTFGTNGIVTTDFGSVYESASSLAIDSVGRIVVVGGTDNGNDEDFALARYTSVGKLDTSFGTDGKITTDFESGDDQAYSLAIDDQHQLVVAGYSDNVNNNNFALARYKENGDLDTSFDTNGKITTDFGTDYDSARSLAIDSQGRLVVAGISGCYPNQDFALARYTSDGILDTSFGTGGKITTDFGTGSDRVRFLAIDSQARLIVVGGSIDGTDEDFALARYTSDGILDTSFGTGGKITTDFGTGDRAYSLAIDSQGRLVVAGYSYSGTDLDFALVRYKENGDLDDTFGTDGIITTDFGSGSDAAYSLAIDDQDRLVVAGFSYNGTDADFALARYIEDKKPVKKSSGGGGCNISSLSALSILLVVPLMFLSKRGR